MRFCNDCGTVLNLFGSNERELCSACVQQQKKLNPPPEKAKEVDKNAAAYDLLGEAILSFKNEKMVLQSKEGWELWSGPIVDKPNLQSILKRAATIYRIRLKRQMN